MTPTRVKRTNARSHSPAVQAPGVRWPGRTEVPWGPTCAALLAAALLVACGGEVRWEGPGGAGAGGSGGAPAGDFPCEGCERPPVFVSECEQVGATEAGACVGGELLRCVAGEDGEPRVERIACPAGGGCLVLDGAALCVGPDECLRAGSRGRCDGDRLWRCEAGVPVAMDCAAEGGSCGYAGDAEGYACLPPDASGALVVTGLVQFEERPLSPGTLGAPIPAPARGVSIAIVSDADDATIATALTADDGSFVLRYDAVPGASVRLVAWTSSRGLPTRPLRVVRASGNAHAIRSASFPAAPRASVDLLATEASGTAEAFHIFDRIVQAMDATRALGFETLAPLTVHWQAGRETGSYYVGSTNDLYLAGISSNDDGYDDPVILHEYGHYFQDEYAASDSPGGAHDGSPADPRLAWGEGSATFVAAAVSGQPFYIDYSPGGGWHVDLERSAHRAAANSGMSQYVSEWMVAELLWDVTDGTLDGDADPVAGFALPDGLAVMIDLAVRASDRGFPGVDLVEWLDRWITRFGSPSCEPLRTLLGATYLFPYDFAPCL